MSESDDSPDRESGDDESDNIPSRLEIIKSVLEIAVAVARLLGM
jgi:hypothetical protein